MDIRFNRLLVAAACLCAFAWAAHADIPSGYYNSLNGKKEAELKTAAYQVIHNLTRVSSYSALPQYFAVTDVYPDSKRWWDMYSDIPLYTPSFSGLNREHSFPKSWWGGLTDVNAYVDLNHLYPSEAKANMAKSNYPLGTVDTKYTPNFDNGITKVGFAVAGQGGGAQYVFEPDDEYKGDFARTYFYMVTCYQDYTWTQKYMYMLQQNEYPTLTDWAVQLLLKWSREDPVSQKEIDRNEAVYKFQNNRNPFIDFPSLAEYIWGNKKGEPFDLKSAGDVNTPTGDPNLITPVQDMALDFGQVALGKSVTSQLFFKGENLTGNLTITVYKDDYKMFAPASNKIATNLVNTTEGYQLNITYTPTELGEHTARLLVSDGGLDGSRGIQLLGQCLEPPTLHACVANPAADIQSDSYLASWSTPDDVVDYYVVTRTKYVNGSATTEELLAEGTELLIDGFSESDREAYYVQSVRLGYTSEPSNTVFVEHAGVTGVETDHPLAVVAMEGAVRIICSDAQTNCRIYDMSGRQVVEMPVVECNTDIALPMGVYLIVTDQCHRPVRAAVK